MIVIASVFAVLAAALHVWIFVMESVLFTRPRIWRIFGIRDQAAAEANRVFAFNQGFYNLFLAIGVAIGIVLFLTAGEGSVPGEVGRALTLFALAAMTGAAVVLSTGGRRYLRPAIIQGIFPALALLTLPFA